MREARAAELRAFARFGVVGISSNASLFAIYLVLTGLGMEPLLAATLMWILGVTISFVLNRSWTFGDTGHVGPALARYGLLYGTAYVLNLVLLALLVARGYPHAWVQGALILLFGVGLFTAQRRWVFRQAPG